MLANCDVIVIFPIYDQFGAIRMPDFGRIVCKTYIFINSNFLSYKNWTKKSLTQLSHYSFEQRYYFCQKILIFCQKNADISKIKKALVLKSIFSETAYVRLLTY